MIPLFCSKFEVVTPSITTSAVEFRLPLDMKLVAGTAYALVVRDSYPRCQKCEIKDLVD